MLILRCAAKDEVLLFDLAVQARCWHGEAPGRLLERTEKERCSLVSVDVNDKMREQFVWLLEGCWFVPQLLLTMC